jgi:hypothetical protein
MPTAQDVLTVTRSLIGVHETPDGSNIAHPITDWAAAFGYSTGDAWCAWTVSYVVWHVNPSLLTGMSPTGYSGDFRTWGQKHGRIIPGPQPGAIDVMDFDGNISFTDHVGIVESVNRDGSWINIEGNHNNQVMRVTRSGGIHWFILPLYTAAPAPKPKQEEETMALVTSGIPVTSFGAICFVGIMGGEPWDVWAKAQNPTAAEITVEISCTTNAGHEVKAVAIPANQIVQVQAGKELKATGNSLVVITSHTPVVCTFDHRPTK